MKTNARRNSAVAVLVLGLAVIVGSPSMAARTGYAEPVYDMIVVQSSVDRKLSSADLDQLHDAVARFLASQGPVRSGEYVVRIDFPPARPGDAAEWIIVKLTNLLPPAFSLAGDNATDESDYGYDYDAGYAYMPYGYYDRFNPYFNDYYWMQGGVPFGRSRHWRGDRDDHDRYFRAGKNGRPDHRDQAGNRKPVDMSKRPRVTYSQIDGHSWAQHSGGRYDAMPDQHTRNVGAQVGHEPRIQAADNLPRTPEARRRDTGSTDRPPLLSGERAGRNSFVPAPPPVRTPTSPPPATNQKSRDTGDRRPEP